MKIARLAAIATGLVLAVSCEKPMSEAERNAQIEREVQQRLEAERVQQEKDRLAQQQAELDAREQELANKESAANRRTTTAAATPRATATARPQRGAVTARDGRPARSYDTFYRKLEPYGAWRETADYGYVWQPEQAQRSRNWRPYTDGRWAYTDAGWTWVSEEPFGWATYHYGRWTRLRGVGWVWVPGDEWAPAWVSWRTSDDYVGWAPLPPEARFERGTGIKHWADSYYDIDAGEYVFVPNEEIGAEEIERVVVPPERNVTIVMQTTNVTNITYSNTYIVNEGPNYDQLRSRSRRPVERLRIERTYDLREEDEQPRASVRDGVIAMMAPLFAPQAAERPRRVGEPIRQVAAERAIAAADEPEAQRARAKMRSEATPPPNAPSKTYEKPPVGESAPESPAPAATAATTPAPTVAATAAPTATATATPRAASTAEPTATPSPRATATVTPITTPTATPRASIAATPTATPKATATATATPTAAPTAAPVTPASTPTPRPTVAETATPSPTSSPPATPRPTATATTTPAVVATSTPRVAATPSPVIPALPPVGTTPRATASPTAVPDADSDSASAGGAIRGRQAERAERQRQKEEARAARTGEPTEASPGIDAAARNPIGGPRNVPGRGRPSPPASANANDTVTSAPAPPTRTTPPAAATPIAAPTPRVVPPAAVATPPATDPVAVPSPARAPVNAAADEDAPTPTPTPSPRGRDKKAKRAADPGEDVDVADDAEAKPDTAEEP